MSITIEQTDTAILETFHNMEEGIEYVLNDFWFAETNRVRKEYDYSLLKDKKKHKFTRKGDHLFIDKNFIFDFTGKSNLAFAFANVAAFLVLGVVALSLQHNGLEKLNKDTCDGKVVEIDGRKYKLTAV